jgi:hypothetical protein
MDQVTRAIQVAERVVVLRAQLAEAEAELRRVVAGGRPAIKKALPAVKRAAVEAAPVSQRVREALQKAPLEFGELVERVGGPGMRMAARSALKKLRAKNEVAFKGGKYQWAVK